VPWMAPAKENFDLKILHNVPAVTDVFLRPIRKMRSILRAQKNVAEQNTTKGHSPDWYFA